MYKTRVILSNFYVMPENSEPQAPPPEHKGIFLNIRAVITPEIRKRLEEKFEIIPDELGIKYISKEDKEYFENQYFSKDKLSSEEMVIEWNHAELEALSEITNPVFTLFNALRILKEGSVFLKYLYTVDIENGYKVRQDNFVVPDAFVRYQDKIDYELKEEDADTLKDIFLKLSKLKEAPRNLDLVLDRFNSTYYTKPARDALIDLMIGYEALFLKDYKGNRKGEALSIACSMLIGGTESERQTMLETLSRFYRVRNKIVHGDQFSEEEIEENFYTLKNYLRRSIIKLLD